MSDPHAESTAPLKRTPLNALHRELGAKMVPFGGWDMPLQYRGIALEHHAVRQRAGLFDVSHMGEVLFTGPRAREAVQRLVTNNVGRLQDGQALYTVACNERGGIVDDCVVYRHAADRYLIVVNASNIEKDHGWFVKNAAELCTIENQSDQTALIAIQGPAGEAILSKGFEGAPPLASLKSFAFARGRAFGVAVVASRTGYTGEDGFEIFCDARDAVKLWKALTDAGAAAALSPCGLGARDTLRLEARLSLYGQDLNDDTTPLEAGLGWVVKLDEVDFLGKAALLEQKRAGVPRKLVGMRSLGRGIPRHGYAIHAPAARGDTASLAGQDLGQELGQELGKKLGEVTSGTKTPTCDVGIAMGYVETAFAEPGARLVVDCRGKPQAVEIVKGPFYKRAK